MLIQFRVYPLLVIGLLLLGKGVNACSCKMVQPCEAYGSFPTIFIGRLLKGTSKENKTLANGDRATYETGTLRFALIEAIKGVKTQEIDVGLFQVDCGVGIDFISGETYLVFASPLGNTAWTTGTCTPTDLVANRKEYLPFLRNPPAPGTGGLLLGNVTPNDSKSGSLHLPRFKITIDDGHGNRRKTLTKEDGSYTFKGVPPGLYTVAIGPRHGFVVKSLLTAAKVPNLSCVVVDFIIRLKEDDSYDNRKTKAERKQEE